MVTSRKLSPQSSILSDIFVMGTGQGAEDMKKFPNQFTASISLLTFDFSYTSPLLPPIALFWQILYTDSSGYLRNFNSQKY